MLELKSNYTDKYEEGLKPKKEEPIVQTEEKISETDAKLTSAELVNEIEQIAKSISQNLTIKAGEPVRYGLTDRTEVNVELHGSLVSRLIVIDKHQTGCQIISKTSDGLVTIGNENGISKLDRTNINDQITNFIKNQIDLRGLRLSL